MTLRMKLDDNPYSLPQDELMSLKNMFSVLSVVTQTA